MKSAILYLPSAVTTERGKEKGRNLTIAFTLFFVIYAVISPKTVTVEILRTSENFVRTAFPAMLPFAIASGMLIKSGFGEVCERIAGRFFRKLFGVSGSLAAAFILGSIAGFPIGVKSACETYRKGGCTKEEAEEALALCSNPGVGFTVAGVGGIAWSDTRLGAMIWASCVLSSAVVAVLFNSRRRVQEGTLAIRDTAERDLQEFSVSRTVAASVSEAAETLIRVFVFVVFFKTVAVVLWRFTALFPFFDSEIGLVSEAAIVAFFEFSSGVSAISDLAVGTACNGAVLRILTVTSLGWSGISVHMQTTVFAASCGISMKKYYFRKLCATVLSAVIYLFLSAVLG